MDQVCKVWFVVIERFAKEFGKPLPKRLLEIGNRDEGWYVQLNPTDEPLEDIEPFNVAVLWNGWPAGVMDPTGGMIAAGELANEGTFIEWLESSYRERVG